MVVLFVIFLKSILMYPYQSKKKERKKKNKTKKISKKKANTKK